MPQTQISCPRCRQMIPAQVEQLFDVTADPAAKQRLLGRVSNYARCPHCGFEGPLATPIVYHDNDKELLLTHFPAELGLPVNEQEKLVGPLISQVMNRLPAEKRKGYLLRSQSFLTLQSMIEKILEKDGVTKEMLDEQQKRLSLIQRLLQAASPDVRTALIKEEAAQLDEAFFAIFNRLADAAVASGQQQTAQAMGVLQEELLANSEYGRKLQAQMGELEAAVKSLQEVGKGLTREKLLELLIAAPSEARVQALVSLTRNGLDYNFFQILTGQIDKASGDERKKLEELREKILEFTNQLDKALEEQLKQADAMIESLLSAPDIAQATIQNMENFQNEAVVQVLETKLRDAQQKNDAARMQKLQQIVAVLQQASTPPELELVNELVDAAGSDAELEKALQAHANELTDELTGMLASLMQQVEQQGAQDPNSGEIMRRLEKVYRAIVKRSMQKNLGK
ncbi:MAG: CpXC domain-containing protein [Chloroflexi bacterium]|nr:CpXC domain-containing protein [Chloroflexota bacterium]